MPIHAAEAPPLECVEAYDTKTSNRDRDVVNVVTQMAGVVDPRKPDSDTRTYRVFTLPNELQVVVCSDPETQSAAAALAVSAGQLQDPPEVQGCAHFLEHMLFLGNEKYPGESDFDSFCASSAGYSNAWTSMDRTVYHYVLAHDKLQDSLDRFSGFFSCPLFTEDLTDRELNAIDSENNKNLQDDGRREFQLLRSTAKSAHPLQRFGTGNLYSLKEVPEGAGTNIREHLLGFHKGCYSANVMKLAVLGSQSLDALEGWVRDYFSTVPNKNLQPLQGVSGDDDPFDAAWKRMYRVIPVKERRKLVLFWPTPSTYENYMQKPSRLISYCIGHEGVGSLLSLLKAKGWATELGAGTGTQSTYFSLFEISIKLTEQGLPNYLEIISLIYQYITACFRRSAHEERARIRHEMRSIEELNFRFRTKVREDQYTEQLACNLSRYPAEHVICGPDLFFEDQDMSAIDSMIDKFFIPSNMRVHVIAPEAEQPDMPAGTTWVEEFWYKSRFAVHEYDAECVKRWADAGQKAHEKLHLPLANPYTPENEELKEGGHTDINVAPAPSLIIDTPVIKLWHLHDTSLAQPKVSCHIQLSNFIVERTARLAICLRMLLEMLHEITNEEAYDAEEAGLIFDISNTSANSQCCGLRLSFKGYDCKMSVLVQRMMKKLATFDVHEHENAFELVKEATITDYRNRRFQQNYAHAMIASNCTMEYPHWNNEERLGEIETITMDEVNDFVKEFLKEMRVEAVIVGNYTAEEASSLVMDSMSAFTFAPLSEANVPKLEMTKLEEGVTVLREQLSPDPDAVDSACVVYYQMGERSVRNDIVLELLVQIMDKEAYAQLRTVEQLGYIVATTSHTRWCVSGLRIIVQSVHAPSFLDTRIETFLEAFGKTLSSLSDADFAEHVDSLTTKKKEVDRSIDKRCARFMTEVCGHLYAFDRSSQEVDILSKLSKQELVEFFNVYVSPSSTTRRKLSCHVTGKQAIETITAAGEELDVTAESASKVLIFEKGAVPFPPASDDESKAAPELPEPKVVELKEFRATAPRYAIQK